LDAQTAEDRYIEAARKARVHNNLSDSELIAEGGDVCAFIPSAADAIRNNSSDTVLTVFSGNVKDSGELFLQYLDAVTILCPRNVANVQVIRGYFTAPATTTTLLADTGALGSMIEDANARAEPSTNSAVSNRISAGARVTVLCEKEGDSVTDADNGRSSSRWYFVPHAGYVSSLYVNLGTDYLATCDF